MRHVWAETRNIERRQTVNTQCLAIIQFLSVQVPTQSAATGLAR